MQETRELISLSPERLMALPTIKVETHDDGTERYRDFAIRLGLDIRMELKLETDRARYWICTGGAPAPGPDIPLAWVVGYATKEIRATGDWHSYGPEHIARLQKVEYVGILWEELESLCERAERGLTPQDVEQMYRLKEEIDIIGGFRS